MSWYHALMVLLHMVHAHHAPTYHWVAYGYHWQHGHRPANAGVVVSLGNGRCVGYETRGHPGFFGNVYGLRGGDCG